MSTTITKQFGKTVELSVIPTNTNTAKITLEIDAGDSETINLSTIANNADMAAVDVTGATDANTPSTIVKRDASGNFSAGVINANITGNASGTASNVTGVVALANGGTGQITANAALNALLPTQSGHAGDYLTTNGTNSSWSPVAGGGSVTAVTASSPLASSGGAAPDISLTGVIPVANGGTNSSAALNNNRVIKSSSGAIVEAAAITASRALVSDSNGIPTHTSVTTTELGYVSGVTSAIQTQINTKEPTVTKGDLTEATSAVLTVTGGTGAVIGSGTTIQVKKSTAAQDGYLASTDFSTFNGKQAAGNYITALTGDVTASGPGSVASTLATVNSNTGSFGSSTAIPNFTVNGKGLITAAGTNVVIAPAGTLTGTTLASNVVTSSLTSVGTITSGTWTGTTIAIANGGTGNTAGSAVKWTTARNLAGNSVDGSANVAFANKFLVQGTSDAGLSGAQFMGSLGTGIVKNTTTTGVQSIAVAADFPTLNQSTTGSAATLTTPRTINGTSFDGSANITVTAAAGTLTGATLAAGVTASSLTSVGTIATGTWSGTTIALNKGGTGQTTKAAAFDALQPMTTSGDIIYGGASGTGTRLAKGSDGQVLTLASGLPSWAAASGGSSPTWTLTTGTWTGTTSNPSVGTPTANKMLYSTNGKVLEINYNYNIGTGATNGSGYFLLTLPNSLTFNSNVVTDSTNGLVATKFGDFFMYYSGVNTYSGFVYAHDSTHLGFWLFNYGGTNIGAFQSALFAFDAVSNFNFAITVPVA